MKNQTLKLKRFKIKIQENKKNRVINWWKPSAFHRSNNKTNLERKNRALPMANRSCFEGRRSEREKEAEEQQSRGGTQNKIIFNLFFSDFFNINLLNGWTVRRRYRNNKGLAFFSPSLSLLRKKKKGKRK